MPLLLHPLLWSAAWIKRHHVESKVPGCASQACAGPQSVWQRLRSRRTGTFLDEKFYCQPRCLETALVTQLSRLRAMVQPVHPPNRIPLGLLMVARGKLTHLEVRAALEAQRRARHGKIGDWFEKLGFASEQDVTGALALQWGSPLVSSFDLRVVDTPGSHPASHSGSLPDASRQLCCRHANSLSRLRRARRPRRPLCHRKNTRLPHSALRSQSKTNRLPARSDASVESPGRSRIRHPRLGRDGPHHVELHKSRQSAGGSTQPHRPIHLASHESWLDSHEPYFQPATKLGLTSACLGVIVIVSCCADRIRPQVPMAIMRFQSEADRQISRMVGAFGWRSASALRICSASPPSLPNRVILSEAL